MSKLTHTLRNLSPNCTVALWLLFWCVVNLLQVTFTQLADDEAYYHIYAQSLAWGYYDHPPFIALLVAMGEALLGSTELGVRLFVVLLQPLYLWFFWRLIRPVTPSRQDATLYVALAASLLMMQLYGFVAVPDAPLMFTTALYLLALNRFVEKPKGWSWLWLSLAMAAMAYSKYQGALVVLFSLLFHPRLLLQGRLYLSGLFTLLLFLPHLGWQYEHDYPSFAYHLSGRNRPFKGSYVTEYILNLLVVFNPFYVPLWVQAYRKVKSSNPLERILKWMPIAFVLFFALSVSRGRVQPQWLIPSCFGLLWILYRYLLNHPRSHRYALRVASVTVGLVALARLGVVVNPTSIQSDMFFNRTSYGAIAEVAAGRPVVFAGGYAQAAKYHFYGDERTIATPSYLWRNNQWSYWDDSYLYNQEVVLEVSSQWAEAHPAESHTLQLANGNSFAYRIESHFLPLRRVTVENLTPLPACITERGAQLTLELEIHNPYNFPIEVDGDAVTLQIVLQAANRSCRTQPLTQPLVLSAGETLRIPFSYTLPADVESGTYHLGFTLLAKEVGGWFASTPQKIAIDYDNR